MDSFSSPSDDVLSGLDPLSRALLDLSVQRGMEDAEIATVLGTDEESVLEVRVGLLRALADKVAPEHSEDDVPKLQAVIADRLYRDREGEAEEVAALEAAVPEREAPRPAPAPRPQPVAPRRAPQGSARKRRSPLVFLLPVLLVLAIAGVVVALASGGGTEDTSQPSPPPTAAKPAAKKPAPASPATAAAKPKPVRLTALFGGDAKGTAAIADSRLTLKVRNLPKPDGGRYQVWLYNSVIGARSIGTSKSRRIDLDAKLPPNAGSYRYIDISREPADGNPNHSGQSVLRVPLKKLQK